MIYTTFYKCKNVKAERSTEKKFSDYWQLLLMLMFETYLNEIENEHTPKLTNCIVSLKISLNIGGVPTPIICCQKWEFQKFLP